MQMQSIDLKQSDHCCVNIDGATVFNIIQENSVYLDSFLQVEEQLLCCLALGKMMELKEWRQGEGNIFSTKNVNHISNINIKICYFDVKRLFLTLPVQMAWA